MYAKKQGKSARPDKGSNPKYRKGKRKFQDKGSSEVAATEKVVDRGVENDASWYGDSTIIRNAANIPFANANGFPLNLKGSNSKVVTAYTPGICTLRMAPTVGYSLGNTSPINIASRNLYSYIIKGKSGAAPFDHSDMMMYLLAMDSIYSAYAWAARTYGLIRFFNQQDRYFPKAIVDATRFNYEDFLQNMANYRYFLNYICNTVNKFYVPSVLNYMKRHFWMYSNIYMDEPVAHCQYYAYVPDGFFQLQISESDGYYLKYRTLGFDWGGTNGITFKQFTTNVQNMIDVINTNQDFSYISAYFLNAFGDGKAFSISPVAEDFMSVPVYSLEVLEQIHNSETSTMTAAEDSYTGKPFAHGLDILANNEVDDPAEGAILAAPKLQSKRADVSFESMLDFGHNGVTPEEVMVCTRNVYGAVATWNTGDSLYDIMIKSCGSDICMGDYYTYGTVDENGTLSFTTKSGDELTTNNFEGSGMVTAFHYGPRNMLVDGTAAPNEKYYFLGEVGNYTKLSDEQLDRMHEIAMQGLFNVPFIGIMA